MTRVEPVNAYVSDYDSHSEVCGCSEPDHERDWPRARLCGCTIVGSCLHDAAPDMLAALEALLPGGKWYGLTFNQRYERIRAAIRKAKP